MSINWTNARAVEHNLRWCFDRARSATDLFQYIEGQGMAMNSGRVFGCCARSKIVRTLSVALLCFASAQAYGGVIQSFQKVSALAGGLSESGAQLEFFDDFGESIDAIGDVDGDGTIDLVVGAQRDDDGGLDRGAVYVLFMNNDGTVRNSQKISDTEGNFTAGLSDLDVFGIGASGLGDINGDGVPDIAVGAAGDDDAGPDSGAIYILFLNTSGQVISHQKISEVEGGFTGSGVERLGIDLARLDDLDGDGIGDLFVAQRLARFWIWNLNADGTVKANRQFSGLQNFGSTAALLGDVDGDGIDDIATGASADDDGGDGRGAVFILFMNANGTERSRVKISDTAGGFEGLLQDGDQFGQSVAPLGDINQDGVPDLLVGAENADSIDGVDSNSGALWLLLLNADGSVLSEELIASGSEDFQRITQNSNLGQAAAYLGDLNGDGIGDIVGAADGDRDGGGTMTGAFYVFFLNRPVVEPPVPGRFQQAQNSDNLLVVEAENFDEQFLTRGIHSWVPREVDPASNNAVMASTPVSGVNVAEDYTTNSPRLDFNVNFTESGTHYLWVRGFSPTNSQDSLHVGFNENPLASSRRVDGFNSNQFDWSGDIIDGNEEFQRATILVPRTGEHRLNVWMREDGFQVDKLLLTTNPNFVPTGMGPAESQRATAPGVGNTPPQVTAPIDQSSSLNRFDSVQVTATDTDNDTLRYEAAGLPAGLSIDSTTGLISGAPTELGEFNVTVTVDDGNTGEDAAAFVWTVVAGVDSNDAPGFTNPGDQLGRVADLVELPLAALDPDGDLLTYTAAGLPTGLSIDASTGVISGTLNAEGEFSVLADTSDGRGGSDSVSFSWSVLPTNNLPSVTDPGPQSGLIGDLVNLSIEASDPDGDALNYAAAGLPTGLAIDSETGVITGRLTAVADFNVTISVADANGGISNVLFNWLVEEGDPSNAVPEVVDPGDQINAVADTVLLTIVATDADGDALNFTATGLPVGLTIDSTSGTITGDILVAGSFSAVVTVGDGNGGVVDLPISWVAESQDNVARFIQSTAPNNLLVVEAENFSTNTPQGAHSWVQRGVNAASQNLLMEATPDSGTNNSTTYAVDSPRLDFEVSFVTTGIHYVWVRGFSSGLGSDSMHVGLDGVDLLSARRVDDFTLDILDWSGDIQVAQGVLQRATIDVVGLGAHTLNVWMREDGFQIDKLFLTTDPNFVPMGVGPGESPRSEPGGGNNNVPTFDNPGPQDSVVGDVVSLQLLATDLDSDPLTFSATGLPDGLAIDSDGLITGTLTVAGSFQVQATVDDGNSGTANVAFDWTVTASGGGNQLPTVDNPGDQVSTLGDAGNLQIQASDSDGDTLTYSATGLPDGLVIDAGTGLISGDTLAVGAFAVEVSVDDNNAGAVLINFNWQVDAPGGVLRFVQSATPGNLLVIEAENFSSNTPQGEHVWLAGDANAASQGGLMTASPERRLNVTTTYATDSPRLDYEVNFVTTGIHYVWVRGFSSNLGADSVHVGFDGQDLLSTRRVDSFALNTFDWSGDIQVAQGALVRAMIDVTTPGAHTLNVWMREDSFQLDKLLLTTDANFVPTSIGPDESPRSTTTGGGNIAPTLVDPGDQENPVGIALALQIDAEDANGDLLTYSATGLPTGLEIDATNGAITGTPSDAGVFNAQVSVADDSGDSTSSSFVWTISDNPPANNPPTVTNPGPQSDTTGTQILLAVTADDIDGDTLTYSATGLPDGLQIASDTGEITGTLSLAGSFDVLLTVADGNGGSTDAAFVWTVTPPATGNNLPSVENPGPQSNLLDEPVNLPIVATDADGDTLSYVANGLPSGLLIDASSGIISGTIGATGTFNVSVTVDDGNLGIVNLLFSWVVEDPSANTDPVLTNPGNQSSQLAEAVTLPILASDADGDSLTFAASGLPTGLLINASSGVISGTTTSTGTFDAEVTVDDGQAGSASVMFTWLVEAQDGVDRFMQSAAPGNLLVVEAENFDLNTPQGEHNWSLLSNDEASAAGLMRALPELRTNNSTNYATDSPQLDFEVNFVTTGVHYVWVRGFAINGGADSVHVGLDGIDVLSSRRVDNFALRSFEWSGDIQVSGALERATIMVDSLGAHTLNVWMREDGFQIDRLLLTTDANFVPTDQGPAESPRSGASGGGNTAPTVIDPGAQETALANVVALQIGASDPDGDSLDYSAVGLPTGLTIDATSGLISGTPSAAAAFNPTVTVIDGNGGTDDVSFSWLITDIPTGNGRFMQSNGVGNLLVMEAENFTANTAQGEHNWAPDTTAGAAAGAAMASLPNIRTNNSTNYVLQSPRLDFDVSFVMQGTHYVWVRGFSPNGGGDSVHVGLDGVDLLTTRRFDQFVLRSFDWSGDIRAAVGGFQRATIEIPAAGDYQLNIWMREDGFIVDKLLVTTDAGFVPAGAGPDESPR